MTLPTPNATKQTDVSADILQTTEDPPPLVFDAEGNLIAGVPDSTPAPDDVESE